MSPANARDLVEHAVFEIATCSWKDGEEDFFRSLARQLCHTLRAEFALVGALEDGGERVRTLAAYTPARVRSLLLNTSLRALPARG